MYVQYEVDNQQYEEELDKSSGYQENDKITVYYNPDNPGDIRT